MARDVVGDFKGALSGAGDKIKGKMHSKKADAAKDPSKKAAENAMAQDLEVRGDSKAKHDSFPDRVRAAENRIDAEAVSNRKDADLPAGQDAQVRPREPVTRFDRQQLGAIGRGGGVPPAEAGQILESRGIAPETIPPVDADGNVGGEQRRGQQDRMVDDNNLQGGRFGGVDQGGVRNEGIADDRRVDDSGITQQPFQEQSDLERGVQREKLYNAERGPTANQSLTTQPNLGKEGMRDDQFNKSGFSGTSSSLKDELAQHYVEPYEKGNKRDRDIERTGDIPPVEGVKGVRPVSNLQPREAGRV
jgi:hypothetical protein